MTALTPMAARLKRAARVRRRLKAVSSGRPRLTVHRSSKHISAQIIDDVNGVTLAAASTLEKTAKAHHAKGSNVEAAAAIGAMIAERAKAAGVVDVVFDRGGYIFHGRVKALAEAAREGGLNF